MKFDFSEYEIGYDEMVVIFDAAEQALQNQEIKAKILEYLDFSSDEIDSLLYKIRTILDDEYS